MALAARNGAPTDLPGWAPANVNSHCPDDARNFHISRAHGLCIPPAQLRTPARKSSNGVQSPRVDWTRSPSAGTSKGFVIVGRRFVTSSRQFRREDLAFAVNLLDETIELHVLVGVEL